MRLLFLRHKRIVTQLATHSRYPFSTFTYRNLTHQSQTPHQTSTSVVKLLSDGAESGTHELRKNRALSQHPGPKQNPISEDKPGGGTEIGGLRDFDLPALLRKALQAGVNSILTAKTRRPQSNLMVWIWKQNPLFELLRHARIATRSVAGGTPRREGSISLTDNFYFGTPMLPQSWAVTPS